MNHTHMQMETNMHKYTQQKIISKKNNYQYMSNHTTTHTHARGKKSQDTHSHIH